MKKIILTACLTFAIMTTAAADTKTTIAWDKIHVSEAAVSLSLLESGALSTAQWVFVQKLAPIDVRKLLVKLGAKTVKQSSDDSYEVTVPGSSVVLKCKLVEGQTVTCASSEQDVSLVPAAP